MHGEVAVLVLSEVPDRFARGATLWTEDGRALTVDSSRPHKDRVLVRFRGVSDRTAAEALQKTLLLVPESSSPPLPDGAWWDHQIEGCTVSTESGSEIGVVHEVIHTAANDVWSAVGEDGAETLIPVLRDILVLVDVSAKRIVVREIPGLTAPE